MQMKNVGHKWTVQDIPSQEGRLAVVTGATSGIGFHTAKELARKRATVIMPARDMRKAKEAAERIEAEVLCSAPCTPPRLLSAGMSRRRVLIISWIE